MTNSVITISFINNNLHKLIGCEFRLTYSNLRYWFVNVDQFSAAGSLSRLTYIVYVDEKSNDKKACQYLNTSTIQMYTDENVLVSFMDYMKMLKLQDDE